MTLEDPHPIPLNYASPMPRLRKPRFRWSFVLSAFACGLIAFILLPYVFRGQIDDVEPFARAALFLMWLAIILYVWLRVCDECPHLRLPVAWALVWFSVFACAVVVQVRMWNEDPGFPNPRFRLPIIWPGLIALTTLIPLTLGWWWIKRAHRQFFQQRPQVCPTPDTPYPTP